MRLFQFVSVVGLLSTVTSELVRYPVDGKPGLFYEQSFSGAVNRPAVLPRTDDPPPKDPQQDVWDKAVCKRNSLLADMASDDKKAGGRYAPPRDTAASPFQDFSDLTKWGYGFLAYDDYYDLDKSLPFKSALTGLGIDSCTKKEGGNNRAMWWEHDEQVTIDGVTYPPTGAYFSTVFNAVDGVIVAWGAYGPKYMGEKKDPPVTVLPKLRAWSDIAWLQWADLTKDLDVKNVRFVFSSPVENTASQFLIKRALDNIQGALKTWPGTEFDMETDEGKAILGSSNGYGIPNFLITHKKQLGLKTVKKVTVFADDGPSLPRPPSLVFRVVDVTTEEEEKDKDNKERR